MGGIRLDDLLADRSLLSSVLSEGDGMLFGKGVVEWAAKAVGEAGRRCELRFSSTIRELGANGQSRFNTEAAVKTLERECEIKAREAVEMRAKAEALRSQPIEPPILPEELRKLEITVKDCLKSFNEVHAREFLPWLGQFEAQGGAIRVTPGLGDAVERASAAAEEMGELLADVAFVDALGPDGCRGRRVASAP
ncbi:hypothetical protein HK101_005967 [Irineochytrium annulatum]|nr:hypothetical protein HK101_005967 [Irineochytrium annulatum]